MPVPATPDRIPQASAVPYRRTRRGVEFCLVTSMRKQRWGFPKGIIDPGETPRETALKEAEEEAGLAGAIEGRPLGRYTYAKWGTTLHVSVYLMRVESVARDWAERAVRRRQWVTAAEALRRLDHGDLRRFVDAALKRLAPTPGTNARSRRS
jgi:8-oxo-dGTP pyrophosphatase MutT (NUDIX family)